MVGTSVPRTSRGRPVLRHRGVSRENFWAHFQRFFTTKHDKTVHKTRRRVAKRCDDDAKSFLNKNKLIGNLFVITKHNFLTHQGFVWPTLVAVAAHVPRVAWTVLEAQTFFWRSNQSPDACKCISIWLKKYLKHVSIDFRMRRRLGLSE